MKIVSRRDEFSGRSCAGWGVCLALLVTAIPVLLVRIPPMLDYPNHYVRMWLLSGGIARAPISAMYAIDWRGASTNIAIDLVASAAHGWLPVTIVAPAVLILALVLPAFGVAILGRRIFGVTTNWHVLCALLAWNWVLLAGFLNFEISLGLALLAASMEGALAKLSWLRMVQRIIFASVILIAHPFGLLFYAALLSGLALGPDLAVLLSHKRRWEAVLRILAVGAAVVVPVLALMLIAPNLPGASGKVRGALSILWQRPSIATYASMLMVPFKSYQILLDVLVVALLAVPPLLALALGRLRTHFGLLVVAAVLFIGCFLMPRQILSTGGIDSRLPCMLALTLGAALLPTLSFQNLAAGQKWVGSQKLMAGLLTAAALLIVAARTAWIGDIWVMRQADFASLERVLARVPANSAVLPLDHIPDARGYSKAPLGRFIGSRTPSFWSYPTLAIMDRGAFVPALFTAAGKQPVRVRAPWSSIAVAEGPLETVDKLTYADSAILQRSPYLALWRKCFDYIVVVDADIPNAQGPLKKSDDIVPVADEGFAQLYKIASKRTPASCPVGLIP